MQGGNFIACEEVLVPKGSVAWLCVLRVWLCVLDTHTGALHQDSDLFEPIHVYPKS